MITFTHTVQDPQGVHARPVALVCNCASAFTSDIVLEANGRSASAKDLMDLMGAYFDYGEKLQVHIEGEDEQAAAEALRPVIESL